MNAAATSNGEINNHAYLIAYLDQLRDILVQHADPHLLEDEFKLGENLSADSTKPPAEASALERLCTIFALSDFERNLL
ncbi:MAG: ATP-binding protein, partial [Nostoc sp.]